MPDSNSRKEHYSLGYGENVNRWMSQRRAVSHADFFLPHLRAGMNLLDCGCGPGSITVDFAEIVAPGRVVGIDIEPLQLERAQALAAKRGAINIEFMVGSAYALPFADASFDAVFAHALLFHLSEPLGALREFRRVLKPGGIVGIRDIDYSAWLMEPVMAEVEEARRLSLLVAEYNGSSPTYARQQRQLLLDAGFARTEASASCVSNGTLERMRAAARNLISRLRTPASRDIIIQQGWADDATLATLCSAVQAWGESPGAFEALMWRAAVGWVSNDQ